MKLDVNFEHQTFCYDRIGLYKKIIWGIKDSIYGKFGTAFSNLNTVKKSVNSIWYKWKWYNSLLL